MKFQMFKCSDPACGYICLTPEEKPVCDDCGKPCVVISDPEERARADRTFKGMLGMG